MRFFINLSLFELVRNRSVRLNDESCRSFQAEQTPPNRFPQIYGFMGGFLSLATIAVTLRITSRLKFSHIGADDISIVIGYILLIGLVVTSVIATKDGLGKHIWDIHDPKAGISVQKVRLLLRFNV